MQDRCYLMSFCTPLFIAGLLGSSIANASSMPPTASYTVSGSPDNWTLDFTVNNNTNQQLYFFGVVLPATDVIGAPSSDWCTACDTPWSNATEGGSNTLYNNVWITSNSVIGAIDPGASLGGFTALDSADLVAPTSIKWFAYTAGTSQNPYTGGGNFGPPDNPGFEGTASTLPEPGSFVLLLTAITAIAVVKRLGRVRPDPLP